MTTHSDAASVADLPRRTAHAVHALIVASKELNSPVTAAEIMLYDCEALSPTSTGVALASARRRGLATFTGRYWVPSFAALNIQTDLEDRYLAETGDGDGE